MSGQYTDQHTKFLYSRDNICQPDPEQPVSADGGHVAATKKLGVVASYPLCACGYIPLDHSRQDGRPGSSPKMHHPAG